MSFDPKTDIPDGNPCAKFDPIPGWDSCKRCGWDEESHLEEARHLAAMDEAAAYEQAVRSPSVVRAKIRLGIRPTPMDDLLDRALARDADEFPDRVEPFVGPKAGNEDGD